MVEITESDTSETTENTFGNPMHNLNTPTDTVRIRMDNCDTTLDTLEATKDTLVDLETLAILQSVGVDPGEENGTWLKV